MLRPRDEAGPLLGMRKWRVVAGIMLGLACASKQDAIWYIFAFAALCVAWDLGARRTAGLRRYLARRAGQGRQVAAAHPRRDPAGDLRADLDGLVSPSTGYDRDYARAARVNIPVISQLYSLFKYHKEMVQFGVGLSSPHPYMSQPWDWFVITRPVAFYWNSYTDAAGLHAEHGGHHAAVGCRRCWRSATRPSGGCPSPRWRSASAGG